MKQRISTCFGLAWIATAVAFGVGLMPMSA